MTGPRFRAGHSRGPQSFPPGCPVVRDMANGLTYYAPLDHIASMLADMLNTAEDRADRPTPEQLADAAMESFTLTDEEDGDERDVVECSASYIREVIIDAIKAARE